MACASKRSSSMSVVRRPRCPSSRLDLCAQARSARARLSVRLNDCRWEKRSRCKHPRPEPVPPQHSVHQKILGQCKCEVQDEITQGVADLFFTRQNAYRACAASCALSVWVATCLAGTFVVSDVVCVALSGWIHMCLVRMLNISSGKEL